MSTRRGFLRLIGAAPVALPVAAKEAAVSMGLSGPLGAAAASQYIGNSCGAVPMPCDPSQEIMYYKDRLASIVSSENMLRYRQEARNEARILDADIAAMRAISPSAAYAMQVERVVQRRIQQERSWIDQGLAKLKSLGHWS